MTHKNRSDYVMYLLKNFSCSTFEQLAYYYQKEYATSQTVAYRSLWIVLNMLERAKKIAIRGEKYKVRVTIVGQERGRSIEQLVLDTPTIAAMRNKKLELIQLIARVGK